MKKALLAIVLFVSLVSCCLQAAGQNSLDAQGRSSGCTYVRPDGIRVGVSSDTFSALYQSADGSISQNIQGDAQQLIQAGPAKLALDANRVFTIADSPTRGSPVAGSAARAQR